MDETFQGIPKHWLKGELKHMSGCHVPLSEVSEKENHDNSLYITIKELEIKNDYLKTKVEILKEMMRDIISAI